MRGRNSHCVGTSMVSGLQVLDKIVGLSFPVLVLGFLIFCFRTVPPRSIDQLYTLKTRILSILPFSGNRWREQIAPEHLER